MPRVAAGWRQTQSAPHAGFALADRPLRQEFDVSRTKTQTVVRTRVELDVALRQVELTAQEDNVLRMRYGVPMAADAPLQFRDPQDPALRAELIDLERRAVLAMDNRVDSQRLTSIIDRMRRL